LGAINLNSFADPEQLASIVHEITQPMTAVTANAHAAFHCLSSKQPDVASARTVIRNLIRDSQDVSDIVRYLRALFCGDQLTRTPLNLKRIVDHARALLNVELEKADVEVIVLIDRKLPRPSGNEIQIRQVLINLMRNAIEAMVEDCGQPRELTIKAGRSASEICIEVADWGHGFPHLAGIRDTFVSTKTTGMGMGLKISQRIVEAHNGRLWAEPRDPRGTVFTIALPLKGVERYGKSRNGLCA